MQPVELVVKVFAEQGGAKLALHALEKRVKGRDLRLVSLAAVQKNAQGSAVIHESQDVTAGQGALWGAVVGGLVGLLGGPAGVVIGAAAGAATGGVTAKSIDVGFSQEFLNEVKTGLKPGSSLLLALVEESWAEKLAQELKGYEGKLLRHAMKGEVGRWIES
jgi:uncharacterized membrane protein